jgi:hypothetical protein
MASLAARKRSLRVPPLQGEDRQAWLAAIVESSFDAQALASAKGRIEIAAQVLPDAAGQRRLAPLAEAHPPLERPGTQAIEDGEVAERTG